MALVHDGTANMQDENSAMTSNVVPSTLPADTELVEDGDGTNIPDDPVFLQIQAQIERQTERRMSVSTATTETHGEEAGIALKTSDQFTSIAYGFQPRSTYEHSKKQTDIMGMVYNDRMKKFVILDAKGITTWCKDAAGQKVVRTLTYPRYEYRVINSIVYARKYNVYFALGKEFSLRVLNRDFEEVCSVTSGIRSILFMLFNPIRDELITGGVGGTKVWSYKQVAQKTFTEIRPMANYKLHLKYELPNVGGSWVKKVELDCNTQHLYCCSDTDLYAYDLDGNEVYHFERAHQMSITGCAFSLHARLLITGSVDTEVKAWSLAGGLVHTFRGHSRPVTNLILHPETSALILTSSLDGSVRIWSLDTMEAFYTIVVSTEGVLWMGITNEKLLYLGTMRTITMWSLNHVTTFWAMARGRVLGMQLVGGEGKSTRLVAMGEDSSVRIFDRKTQKNLSTVLPPPSLSPMQRIKSLAYNRIVNVVYLLVNQKDIWVYTSRTDPACRIAVWDALEIQQELMADSLPEEGNENDKPVSKKPVSLTKDKVGTAHRATENGSGNETISSVCCLCYLNSTAIVWTDEGFACPIQHHFLLWGLEDGRILFMDPVVRKKKHFEFRANKDAILEIKHDQSTESLMTRCKPGDYSVIQIWSLPKLELLYEVYCPPDVTGFVRMGTSLVTSHSSGAVITHTLVSNFDAQGGKSKYEEHLARKIRKDHAEPVVALDACQKLGIFITCSPDGVVKVWEENKTLLTEIVLDESLTSVSFLNTKGDVAIGFRKHVFFIDHSKICPTIESPTDPDEENETESDVYEDPAVMYEGVSSNPDPIDLESYLVPFDIDFSTDFLEGRKSISPVKSDKEEQEEDDAVSEVSAAPTDTYMSPFDTPRRLSMVDLTLSKEVTQHDLRSQMKAMLEGKNLYKERRNTRIDDEDDELIQIGRFEFPRFGKSPGPSPTPSPPSGIPSPGSMAVSEDGASSPEPEPTREETPTFKPIQVEVSTPAKKVEAPKPVKKEPEESVPVIKPVVSRFSNIKIDSADLMKGQKKAVSKTPAVQVPKKEADHAHIRPSEPVESKSKQVARPVRKKERKSAKERKLPKRGEKKRASVREEDIVTQISKDTSKPSQSSPEKKPEVKEPVEPEESSSSEEEDDDDDTPRPVKRGIPTSSLEIKPRTFGAGASAGSSSSSPSKKPSRRRHMIELSPEPKAKPSVGVSPTPDSSREGDTPGLDADGVEEISDRPVSAAEAQARGATPIDKASTTPSSEKARSKTGKPRAGLARTKPAQVRRVASRVKSVESKPQNIPGKSLDKPAKNEPESEEELSEYEEAYTSGAETPVDEDLPEVSRKAALLRKYKRSDLDKELEELGFHYDYERPGDPLRPPTPPNYRPPPLDISGIREAMAQVESGNVDYVDMYASSDSVTEEEKRRVKVRKYKYRPSIGALKLTGEEEEALLNRDELGFKHRDEPVKSQRLSLKDSAARVPAQTSLLELPEGVERPTSAKKRGRSKSPALRQRSRSPRPRSRQSSPPPVPAPRQKPRSPPSSSDTPASPESVVEKPGLEMDVTAVVNIPLPQKPTRAPSARSILKPYAIDEISRAGTPQSFRVAFRESDGADEIQRLMARSASPGSRRSGSPGGLTSASDGSSSDEERQSPVQEILDKLGGARIGSARHRLALELAALNGEIPPEYHPDYRPGDDPTLLPTTRAKSASSRAKSATSRIKSAGTRAKSPYDRAASPTMTIYSDHGSEWTVPVPDDYDLARLDDILEDEERAMRLMRENWAKGLIPQRPASVLATSSQARPNTPQDGVIRPWRPHTAHELPSKTEDLRAQFEDAMKKFQGNPGGSIGSECQCSPPNNSPVPPSTRASSPAASWASLPPIHLGSSVSESSDWEADCLRFFSARSPEYVDKLYRNDGVQFDDSYHDRQIERHLLMRMQKQLRAQSASEKRQLLQLRQQQRRKGLLGHTDCDVPKSKTKSDSTLHVIRNLQQRAATAGPASEHRSVQNHKQHPGYRSAGPSVMGYNRGMATPATRPNTAATRAPSAFSRPGTAAYSAYSESGKTPAEKSELGAERPFRLGILPEEFTMSTPEPQPGVLDPVESYQFLQSLCSPPPSVAEEPVAPSPSSNSDVDFFSANVVKYVPCRSPMLAKRGIRKRVRIAKDAPRLPQKNKIVSDEEVRNAKLLDPRNPSSKFFKQPSKSIPSKCSRYILITHPKPSRKDIQPTALEQQLIEERFPEWKDKWISAAQQSPRQQYISELGINPYKDYEPQPVFH